MNFEDDFKTLTGEAISKMRLVLEGAVALLKMKYARSIGCCGTTVSCLLYRPLTTSALPRTSCGSMFVCCRRHITRQRSSKGLFKQLRNYNEKSTKEPPLA